MPHVFAMIIVGLMQLLLLIKILVDHEIILAALLLTHTVTQGLD